MKSLNFKAIAALMISATMCLVSCKDELSVSPSDLSFDAVDQQTKSFSISTDAKSWSFKMSDGWATGTSSGNQLSIKVNDNNDTSASRSMAVTVSAGNADPVTVTVTQAARDALSVGSNSIEFEGEETGTKQVEITTKVSNWTATSSASWVTTSQAGNALNITVSDKNPTTQQRQAIITINAGNASPQTLTVTQKGATPYLTVSPTSLSFTSSSSSAKSITVSTNESSWSFSASSDWIHPSKSGNTLSVSVDKNEGAARSGNIIISAGNASSVTVKVSQESGAPDFPSNFYLGAGIYYANEQNTGTGLFAFLCATTTDAEVGLFIQGYSTLLACSSFSASTYKITAGTYNISKSGALRTFYPGNKENGEIGGTHFFDEINNKYIAITGGTFTVAYSGTTCTITTDFTGTDLETNVQYKNIVMTYTGVISWKSDCTDPEPPKSTYPYKTASYVGSGTLANEKAVSTVTAPTSWAGQSKLVEASTPYYTFNPWANISDGYCYLKYVNGQFVIDTRVQASSSGTEMFFAAVTIASNGTVSVIKDYVVAYNSTTKVLDFSGTYNGLAVLCGIIKVDYSKGVFYGGAPDLYKNLKINLVVTSSAPVTNSVIKTPFKEVLDNISVEGKKGVKFIMEEYNPALDSRNKAPLLDANTNMLKINNLKDLLK
jgi:hypothetical protein